MTPRDNHDRQNTVANTVAIPPRDCAAGAVLAAIGGIWHAVRQSNFNSELRHPSYHFCLRRLLRYSGFPFRPAVKIIFLAGPEDGDGRSNERQGLLLYVTNYKKGLTAPWRGPGRDVLQHRG